MKMFPLQESKGQAAVCRTRKYSTCGPRVTQLWTDVREIPTAGIDVPLSQVHVKLMLSTSDHIWSLSRLGVLTPAVETDVWPRSGSSTGRSLSSTVSTSPSVSASKTQTP